MPQSYESWIVKADLSKDTAASMLEYERITKANLSWNRIQAKFYQQLIASLICVHIFLFSAESLLRSSSLSFVSLSWSRITDKLTINWQNFAQVRLQQFSFIIRSYVSGCCRHEFESHSQSFLLAYSEADFKLVKFRLLFPGKLISSWVDIFWAGYIAYSQW